MSRAGCDVNSRTRCFCISRSHLLVFVGNAGKVVRSASDVLGASINTANLQEVLGLIP